MTRRVNLHCTDAQQGCAERPSANVLALQISSLGFITVEWFIDTRFVSNRIKCRQYSVCLRNYAAVELQAASQGYLHTGL